MVLVEPPPRPLRWKFRDTSIARQTRITEFARQTPQATPQILPDDQRDWTRPVDLTICRKGFLLRTDRIENREIVRRSLRDLTLTYPESNYERQRKKHAQNQWGKTLKSKEEAPLEVFCSYKHQSAEEMFQPGKAQEIGEKADWITSMEEGTNANGNKLQRASLANYILVPKFFLLEQLKNRGPVEINNENTTGEPMADSLQFNVNRKLVETERRPQITATNFALHHLRTSGGAVLVLPVGCGKTVCALYIAMQLRVCTLIVIGNTELMDQWKERLLEYCPNARIGHIQGPVCEVDNCDFIIASTSSLAERLYPTEKLRKIGLVIFDEAHHAAAPTFLTAVWQVAAPYMLALTADPTRKDGMTNVLYHFFSYNVFIVLPQLPPGIQLYNFNHKFHHRCFIQDADSVSSTKLKERRQNAAGDVSMLEYCEALASFDKKNYAAACMSSANIALQAQSTQQSYIVDPRLPGVALYHAQSAWNQNYCKDDVKNLTYTQIYQSLQADAHRNAVMVAYIKQILRKKSANDITQPTTEEINDVSVDSVFEAHRFHVQIKVETTAQALINKAPTNEKTTSEASTNEKTTSEAPTNEKATREASTREASTSIASTSNSMLKEAHLCTRDELQKMQQVERQILVLASEREHIDAFHDRLVKSGIDERMIGVYVGGSNKRLSRQQKNELLARRILLGTYPMAGEGLDVATLNVVAFLTPRSSITDQAIGRGLRDKLNPDIMPIVLDFVDEWCQMTHTMHYGRCKSYQFYNAIRKNFDDYSSFHATGAVCWKKPPRNRTQRLTDKLAQERAEKKEEKAALKRKKNFASDSQETDGQEKEETKCKSSKRKRLHENNQEEEGEEEEENIKIMESEDEEQEITQDDADMSE